jgi:hypothetical protein
MSGELTGLNLSDVGSATIISIWRRVFELLKDDKQTVVCMSVCKAFRAELGSLVKKINLRGKPITQQDLEVFAARFPRLQELRLSLEYDDYDGSVLDFRECFFPCLR